MYDYGSAKRTSASKNCRKRTTMCELNDETSHHTRHCGSSSPREKSATETSVSSSSSSGHRQKIKIRPGMLGYREKDKPMISKDVIVIRTKHRRGNESTCCTAHAVRRRSKVTYESLSSDGGTASRLSLKGCCGKCGPQSWNDQCNLSQNFCGIM